jgi:chorismate mutase-like protein
MSEGKRPESAGAGDPAPSATRHPPSADELSRLRTEIERLDRQLVELIAERVRLAQHVGAVKRAAGLPVLDPPREAAVVRRAGEAARELGLADDAMREIFWRLIALSRDAQERLEGPETP